ncbi:AAEL009034-PA [Aedes aegypti]|uniref:AAEL009034-PA n=1 Tax=Aedes aegypti TaxID=7159 RepID=Q16X06_AEDAE|nr:AAEL009034-PA [Aedes aegypti]
MAKAIQSEEDFLQAFNIFENEEASPVMRISEMSEKQVRRLSISPAFREELDRVYAKKAAENGSVVEKDRNSDEDNRSKIPIPPKLPQNRPMVVIEEKEEENNQSNRNQQHNLPSNSRNIQNNNRKNNNNPTQFQNSNRPQYQNSANNQNRYGGNPNRNSRSRSMFQLPQVRSSLYQMLLKTICLLLHLRFA